MPPAATYRVGGKMDWACLSGQAIIALQNFGGSGRKITVRRIDIDVQTSFQGPAGATLRGNQFALLARGTLGGGGEPVEFVENDTNSAALPSQVTAWTLCGLSSPTTLARVFLNRNFTALGGNDLAAMVQHGRAPYGLGKMRPCKATTLESYTLREGECIALIPSDDRSTIPLEVSAEVRVGSRSYSLRAYTTSLPTLALLAINNASGSGVVVEVRNVRVSELGSTDTPYLQVVPVGSVDPAALVPANRLTPNKNDTNSPTLDNAKVAAFKNVAILPFGVPQSYIQESSAGSPKGYNYLHTKDFAGPVWRVCFPELRVGATGLAPDGGSKFLQQINLLGRTADSGIVLRPSEGLAVVSAAENATGAIVGVAAWTSLEIWLTITDEPLIAPSVTLTGLASGTVVAVVQQGTETLIEVLSESGGSITYNYNASPGTLVDFNILAAGKVWQRLSSFNLVEDIQTIPMAQVADVVYGVALSEAVTFDGNNKWIICDTGNTSLSVPATYTEWVDWSLLGSNLRFFPAFTTQGGTDVDPVAGTEIPKYCYLINAWRIRPQEASHTLAVVDGIVLVDGGGDPFVNTLAAFTVRINYQQPVQAIAVASGGGGGSGDWTPTEKEHIRNRLGIDGSASVPAATPTLATAAAVAALPTAAGVRAEMDANSTKLDVATSTRLAAAAYVSPDNAGVAAVKAKTDNLPAFPASEATVAAVGALVDEVHTLRGLNALKPVTHTPSSITASGIALTLTGDGETSSVVQRT